VDRIKEMLDQLSELDDAQVDELQSQILSEFETVEKETPLTPQTVDAMTSLAEMFDTVKAEKSSREVRAQELAQQASEAAARVHGDDAEENMDASSLTEGEDPLEDPAVDPEAPTEEISAPVEDMPPTDAPPMDMPEDMPIEDVIPVDESAPADEAPEEAPEDSPVDETEDDAEGEASDNSEDDPEKKVFETMSDSEASAVTEETVELSTETAEIEETPVTAAADEAPAEDAPAVTAAADEAPADVPSEATELSAQDETNMEAPVTAAAVPAENLDIEVPADRRPVPQVSATPVAITAGADIPGYTAGSSMNDMNDVAEAMVKRIHSLRRVNGGDGEQHIVASLTLPYPEERTLTTDAESNWAKIQNVVGPEALVAAGGHQAPFEVKYDIFGFGTTARPVKDALPRFQADRGGIRYILPPVLSDYPNAVGVWTAANDAAETPNPAAKNSLTVAAAVETTVATDAVTLQLQFGNLVTRAYPELVARHNELALIQHAREAEQNLLAQLTSGSTAVTSTSLIGVARDFLVQVGKAAAAYRSRHRLEPDASLRVIIPSWVKDAMVADLTLQMPGDSTMSAGGVIDGYLADRGVVASYTLDQNIFGSQGVAALLEFPDSFTWWMFAEGTFLFLDGGTLDIGIIRDSTLVGTNDYKMFLETFEAIAKVGIEGLSVTSSISVNGVAAALRDTTGGATAAAIEY
jgi:hypothetical protein